MTSCYLTSRFLLLACAMSASHLWPVHAWLRISEFSGRGLHGDFWTSPDPYIKVRYGGFSATTEAKADITNPVWTEQFDFPFAKPGETLYMEVWDKDLMYDDLLGKCKSEEGVEEGSYTATCRVGSGSITFSYLMF